VSLDTIRRYARHPNFQVVKWKSTFIWKMLSQAMFLHHWGPFLRSATYSDFPRPVRSVRRQRLAATVFARSKPVNGVKILPKMCMLLKEKSKIDVLHILVRTHLNSDLYRLCGSLHGLDTFWARGLSWIYKETTTTTTLIGFYVSAIMYAPGHHWPNMSKTQPLDLDHSSSERTGVV